MLSLPHRAGTLGVVLATLASGLGACATAADLSYGEYQLGPGYQTERRYERRVYGDATQGFESEACRVVVRRRVNEFGEMVVRRTRVCDEAAQGYGDEQWSQRGGPRNPYPDP